MRGEVPSRELLPRGGRVIDPAPRIEVRIAEPAKDIRVVHLHFSEASAGPPPGEI
jgi:hypothetical protein|tara:strand:- start:109 stop:273 length:165 start_codon:yes stop_codon:yes gene_type:complete